jgi:hypothetical protein
MGGGVSQPEIKEFYGALYMRNKNDPKTECWRLYKYVTPYSLKAYFQKFHDPKYSDGRYTSDDFIKEETPSGKCWEGWDWHFVISETIIDHTVETAKLEEGPRN